MLMKNKFSKFINLQGKYLTSLLFVLFFAVGQMWAADPTYESYDWDETAFNAVIGTHGSITISQSGIGSNNNVNSRYYFNNNQNLKNSDATWKYFGISSTEQIDSIEVLYCTNGSTTSKTNVAWVAWGKNVTPNQYTLAHGVTSPGLVSKTKTWADATWEKIDLSEVAAYTVYLSRSIREFREIGGSSNLSNFGGGQTVCLLGLRVWLHPSSGGGETPVSGYAITTSATNGEITTKVGGSAVTSAEKDATVDIEAIPAMGYGFTSWDVYKTGESTTKVTLNADDDSNNRTRAFTMPAYAVTVGATFTAINYTVTHNAATNGTYTIKVGDAEAVSENTTAHYNQTVTLTATPAEGYELSGWTVMNGETPVEVTNNQFTMPAASVTVSATFAEAEPPCATLTPATSGSTIAIGDVIAMQTGSTGGTMTAIVKSGSTSSTLAYNANGLSFASSGNTSRVSVELNHLMQVGTEIEVTLMANGNGNDRGLDIYNASGTKKGLLGWTSAQSVTSGTVASFKYTVVAGDGLAGNNVFMLYRNNSVYLQSLTVSNCGAELFDLTSAVDPAGEATVTLSASKVAAGGSATATYSISNPTAYDFDEWVISSGDATIADSHAATAAITMGTGNAVITLKLKAASVKHTVTYYDGTTELGTELVEEGSNPTATGIVAPHKLGYTFDGWSTTNGGAAVALNTISVAADMPLYTVWSAVDCSGYGVKYSYESKSSAAPSSDIDYPSTGNATADLADYATISGGYAIAGNNSSSKHVKIVSSTAGVKFSGSAGYMLASLDCALAEGDTIRFVKTNKIKLSFDLAKEKAVSIASGTGENKDYYIVPAIYAGEDSLYIWRDGNDIVLTSLKVIRPEKFAVSFNMHDHGTAPEAQSIVEGGKVTEPSAPTAEGWSFGGWYKEDTYDNAWDFATDVVGTSAVELHAKWTAWPTVTLNRGAAPSGDDENAGQFAPGATVEVPACPFSYTDYNFNGWAYSPAVTMVDETHFTMPSENLTLTAQWVDANNVAQIGSTKYATLEAALEHAADGEIVLLQDIDVTAQVEIAAGVTATIDLAGHKIEYTGATTLTSGVIMVHNGASLTINDSSNPDAGSIVAGNDAYAAVALTKAGDNPANPAVLVVNGGTLIGYYYGITGHGSRPNTITTINGGVITATATNDNLAIYHPQAGTLTVNGGTLTGYNTAIEMRAGELEINGGTFTATAPTFSCNPNGSGTTTVGAAIAIAQHTTKVDIAVTINGGEFNGVKAVNESNPQVNDPAPQVAMAITDGEFNGAVETVDVNNYISGGTFSNALADAQCATDYYPATKPNGKYGVTYAAESIDFEAIIDALGTGDAAKAEVTAQLAAKHYELSEALNTDYVDAPAGKPQDKGLKVKKTGLEIYFSVEPEKVLEIKTGNISGASLSINGGAAEDLTSTSIATHTYYNDNAQAVVLRMTKADNKYNIFQSINIRDPYQVSFNANGGDPVAAQYATPFVTLPSATNGTQNFIGWFDALDNKIGEAGESYTPTADIELIAHWEAISTDARLASITLDPSTGVLEPAFDPEVVNYTYTMPYGTAAVPQITGATAVSAKAKAPVIDAQATAWGETAVIRGVAESDDSKAYNITMVQGPKDGICLAWVNVTGQNAASLDADKSLFAPEISASGIKNSSDFGGKTGWKFNSNPAALEIENAPFKAGDIVEVFVTTTSADKMRVFKADEGIAANVVAEGAANMVQGANRVALTEDADNLYLLRAGDFGGWNPYVAYVAVYRACAPILNKITVAGVEGAPVGNVVEIEVPASTTQSQLEAIAYDWVSNDDAWTAANAPVATNAWEFGVANTVTFTDKDGDESVYTVTISKALPSNDATLASLTVNGQAIALADGVYSYDFELPYGTSVVPTVVATAHHVAAVATVDPCTLSGATITVVPESGEDDKQVYTLTFTIAAWKEIVIWDGSYMTELATSPEAVTGMAWATTGFGSIGSYNTTYGEKAYTKYLPSGGSATSRYMTLTVPKDYVAKFYVVMASHSDGSERGMFIGSNLVKDPDATSILELSNNDRDVAVAGMSEIVGEGTYYINPNASIDFQEIRAYLRPGYARTSMLSNGVLGTVCVPNNVAIEDIQGVTVYELMGREPEYGKLAFDEIISGELEAGAPYVFQAHGDKMILFYGETSVANPVDKGNGMYGTFTDQTLTELDDVYYFAQRALWSCSDLTSLSLPANRAYVKLSEVGNLSDPNPAPGRRRVTMNINGEKVATGMDNLNASEQPIKVMIDGQLFIICGKKMFDATGRLVK